MADITTKFLRQTACYWGNPQPTGYGAYNFDDPVEIICRWTDSIQVVKDSKGNEVACKSVVMTAIDIDELGMLYLGELDDLDSGQEADPVSIPKCYQVVRFDKIPTVKCKSWLRVAYL